MGAADRHAVTEYGSGDAVVVLGHGLGGDQTQWRPVAESLGRTMRVITFDHAASGRCDPSVYSPARHSSILGFADDIAAICADLGVRDATFVGHSMSGMAGALTAAGDPGLFSRLVLVGASARYVDDPATGYVGGFTEEQIAGLLDSVRSDFQLWSAGFAPYVMGNADRPDLADEFTRSLREYPPEVAHTVFGAAFTSDFRAVMPRVQAPTLLLQSRADPAVPLEAAQWLAGAIDGSTLEVLDVEGHFPHVVDPDLMIRVLAEHGVGTV